MTFKEFREAVIQDIIDQMAPELVWTRDDAEGCMGDVFPDYRAGKTPRATANEILYVASQPDIN